MRPKFKIGDKVVISNFPMRMTAGLSPDVLYWYENQTVFTVTNPSSTESRSSLGTPTVLVKESSWYFADEDMCLAKGYKRPKRIMSWSMSHGS